MSNVFTACFEMLADLYCRADISRITVIYQTAHRATLRTHRVHATDLVHLPRHLDLLSTLPSLDLCRSMHLSTVLMGPYFHQIPFISMHIKAVSQRRSYAVHSTSKAFASAYGVNTITPQCRHIFSMSSSSSCWGFHVNFKVHVDGRDASTVTSARIADALRERT
jgi:hypothetical protein